jgi:YVTN family beta-propeller protein
MDSVLKSGKWSAVQGGILVVLVAVFLVTVEAAAEPAAYVVNQAGESLSRIDLTGGGVTNDFLTLGSDIQCGPNQIVIRYDTAYVVLSGTNEIQIIDLTTETTVDFVDLPEGSNPFWMAFWDDTTAYVTLLISNAVARVDLTTRTVTGQIPLGGLWPEGIAFADSLGFVAMTGFDLGTFSYGQGKVIVFDPRTDLVVDSIFTGTNPQYIDLDRDGDVHVSCTGDFVSTFGVIYDIDPISLLVNDSLVTGGSPGMIGIGSNDTGYLAAGGWTSAEGYIYSYDASAGLLAHGPGNPIVVDSGAFAAVVFQDNSVFVGSFRDRINRVGSDGVRLDDYDVGDNPVHLDFNYVPGDVNGDWSFNVSDAVFLIGYIFKGGEAPGYPCWRADVNSDAAINVSDAVYIVSRVFKGGPPPKIGPVWVRP